MHIHVMITVAIIIIIVPLLPVPLPFIIIADARAHCLTVHSYLVWVHFTHKFLAVVVHRTCQD